jgi:hypothetical protein
MNELIFRFFLNFKNDSIGRLEITEPIGFDGATFTIEQDKKRYGRDVAYGSEEVSLEFFSGVYNNGLSYEFENLINYYKDYGFESEVEFIVNKNEVDFVVGLLDFQLAETDQLTYFKTKVIQNTNKAQVKRREGVNVDVFSDKDLDDNDIEPIGTQNIFLKAKPIVQISDWKENENFAIGFSQTDNRNDVTNSPSTISFGANNCNVVQKYGIENTLSFMDNRYVLNSFGFPNGGENFTYLEAVEDLTNVKISITDLIAYTRQSKNNFFTNIVLSGSGYVKFVVKYGYDNGSGNDLTTIVLYQKDFGFVDNTPIEYLPNSFDVEIPLINRGMRLWIYLETYSEATFNQYQSTSLANYSVYATMETMKVNIIGTSTAVSSVIKGVRYIDYLKQVFKSATGLNVISPKYDIGGQFYDNFVFNGKLIRQFIDDAFYGTIKENVSQLVELNSDYQVNRENVYVGQYNDFYTNKEIGSYLTAPEQTFKSSFNERYTINTLDYKYKSFEQDRDESNTIDAIHTSTQWLTPNKQVENTLKIEVDFVRDPFEIESARRQGIFTKDTTSLSNDDKVYQLDIVEIAPDSRYSFTAVLQYQYSDEDNTFKLLSNGQFNWTLLGFGIGDTIKVNDIDYVVSEFESSVLTLYYSGVLTENGSEVFTLDYPLTDVLYTNRTSEEFDLIENIATGDNFSNLQYSIGRNLEHWYSYLKTACKFAPNGKIKNTYYKSNGEATTQFRGGNIITENADILVSDLGDAILSPYVYNTKLIADYNDVLLTLEQMESINLDNSIGGFIRVMDNEFRMSKIYPTKLSYKWATAELEITGEVKQDSEFLEITFLSSGLILIDEVGYDRDIIFPIRLKTENDYIQILDKKGIALNNKIKFDKVRVNSNFFSNIVELSNELLTL